MRDDIVIARIMSFVRENGGIQTQFQVGLTNDVRARLEQHGASNKPNISQNTDSRQDAKDTEEYLLSRYSFKGDTGGGEPDSTFLYCFKL